MGSVAFLKHMHDGIALNAVQVATEPLLKPPFRLDVAGLGLGRTRTMMVLRGRSSIGARGCIICLCLVALLHSEQYITFER
jgi:hypothetical protein